MNKLLPILVLVVFFGLLSLWLFSGEDDVSPAVSGGDASETDDEKASSPLTDADRDTYVNTIKTMSARNNDLQARMEALEKRLQEKERDEVSKDRNIEAMVNQTVEDRARNLSATFSDKVDQLRREVDKRTRTTGTSIPPKGKSGIPKGLGFDNLPFSKPSGTGALSIPMLGDSVTIMPITSVAMAGEGDKAVPVGIDGTPLDDGTDRKVTQRRRNKKQAKPANPPVPFYTIPQNATLFSNDTLTALVGIVPNLNGSVVDPIRFKVITGNTNLATNRQFLPANVMDIVWSGIAIGNREMSCVRGEVHSVTFTFEDGTIRTVNSQTDSGKNVLGGKLLGYISTRQGNPCLPGTLITNAQDYLTDRMLASGAAALAGSFADTQKTTTQFNDGTTSSFFDGDEGKYVAGQTLAGSLSELTSYMRERQRSAVDLVYLDAGQDVVLHVEAQIDIDYDPEGRKLDHAIDHSPNQLSYHLD